MNPKLNILMICLSEGFPFKTIIFIIIKNLLNTPLNDDPIVRILIFWNRNERENDDDSFRQSGPRNLMEHY